MSEKLDFSVEWKALQPRATFLIGGKGQLPKWFKFDSGSVPFVG